MIRPATAADAALIAALAERTFREAFGDQNPPEEMDLHCRRNFGADIQAREIAAPDRLTLLVAPQGEAAGFAQLRWGPAEDGVEGVSPGEIQRFYLLRAFHGAGLAAALMTACLEALRARGSDVAWLGVWEENPRAIAFYRKQGFAEVGRKVFMVGTDPQRDLVMARPLNRTG
ncbi:MAG: GNAT family N-acetyltransferase [Gammaproteobacteria bacterium]|nr:GNAT family N-acetyltransferase [Gammaproteobacteria bacterium]